ncbi:methionyl-tRNA formyltransferase [Candidatus Dojkabacteria bacterium]|nr:methionyl-tRNA formyltransferase [Candidatus Dojkabacteria bacterium]
MNKSIDSKVKVLFTGTSGFAVPILQKLAQSTNVEMVGVVTQPDRPVGRHHADLQPSAVGGIAMEIGYNKGFEVYKPEKLAEEAEVILENTKPELVVVASYGQMIPEPMLKYPKYGCINVHASILPKLRGAVPIPMAIFQDFEKTGVSFQKMVKKLDAGDVIASYEVDLEGSETTETLTKKLSDLAAEKMDEVIYGWVNGELKSVPQVESKATYCSQKEIAKSQAKVLPTMKVDHVERMVRAFYPWPVAWGFVDFNGEKKRLKIFEARVVNSPERTLNVEESDVLKISAENGKLFLDLVEGKLELLEIQLEGKERKPASEYLFLA